MSSDVLVVVFLVAMMLGAGTTAYLLWDERKAGFPNTVAKLASGFGIFTTFWLGAGVLVVTVLPMLVGWVRLGWSLTQ